jgi:hypothetical protein
LTDKINGINCSDIIYVISTSGLKQPVNDYSILPPAENSAPAVTTAFLENG